MEWISVKERPPELKDDSWVAVDGRYRSFPVLITYLGIQSGEPLTGTETAVYRDDGCWYWGDTEDLNDKVLVEITAWMPLPEPYQEGSRQ